MDLLLYVAVGLAAGLAVLVLTVAVFGTPQNVKLPSYARDRFTYPVAKQLLYPAAAFVVVFAATGWLVAGLGAAAAAAVYPRNVARGRAQARHVALTEAVGSWIEQLRDSVVSGGGIEMPLRRSAETGPELLRPQLRQLAVAMDTHDTEDALAMFAHDVGHHLVDMLAISYAIAVRESTRGLSDLLGAISESARDEVATFQRVESSRKKIKSSVRMILAIQAVIVGLPVVFGRQFLTAYDSLAGQSVLLTCVVLVLGSQLWIAQLSTVRRPPRFFAVDSDDESFDEVEVDTQGRVVLH